MRYLVNTNVCIEFIRGRNAQLVARVQQVPAAETSLCSIVLSELIFGALNSPPPREHLQVVREFAAPFRSLPFDDLAADEYGRLRRALQQAGAPIGSHDPLIAAITGTHGLTVVTHNQRESGRVPNLRTEDWLE